MGYVKDDETGEYRYVYKPKRNSIFGPAVLALLQLLDEWGVYATYEPVRQAGCGWNSKGYRHSMEYRKFDIPLKYPILKNRYTIAEFNRVMEPHGVHVTVVTGYDSLHWLGTPTTGRTMAITLCKPRNSA